jgi:hypothetical protein
VSTQQQHQLLTGASNGFALTQAADITIGKMKRFTRYIHRGYNAIDAAEISFGHEVAPFVVVTLLELHMKGSKS